jgi:cardiolipin synthase
MSDEFVSRCVPRHAASALLINLPNLVTFSRVVLTGVVVVEIFHAQWRLAFWMSIVAGSTDLLDGFLARIMNVRSRTGAYFDPIADKLLLSATFLALGIVRALPWWMVALVFGRDLFILGMAVWGYLFTTIREFPPSIWGKLSTFAQIIAALAVMNHHGGSAISDQPFLWIMMVTTAWSGVHYGWRGWTMLKTVRTTERVG